MAVWRNRSTNIAPEDLSSSCLTGVPPTGISISALRSEGGFLPALIFVMSTVASIPFRAFLADGSHGPAGRDFFRRAQVLDQPIPEQYGKNRSIHRRQTNVGLHQQVIMKRAGKGAEVHRPVQR